MNDQVILHIGDNKFLVTPEEGMRICEILCGASRIAKEWIDREKSSAFMVSEPDIKAAVLAPFTMHLQLECETNRRYKENKS